MISKIELLEKNDLNSSDFFFIYFLTHLKLFPWCSGTNTVPRKQPADLRICCGSDLNCVTGLAALQQLIWLGAEIGEITYFVKYKWSVLSKLKLSRVLLINTHTTIFGCQLPFGYGNLTISLCFNDCSAELLYCKCEAQQALEHPTGAGCHHTCLQHGAGGRQPRGEVTEQLRSILTTMGWDSSNTGRRDHSHPQVHTGQSLNSPENWKVGNRELYKLREVVSSYCFLLYQICDC